MRRYILIFAVFTAFTTNSIAQDICESMLTSDLKKIETKLNSLKTDPSDFKEVSHDLETITEQLAACADNTDGDLSVQTEKLSNLKAKFEKKNEEYKSSTALDIQQFLTQFSMTRRRLFMFPNGAIGKNYDPTIINRKNLEFILTYKDHPYKFDVIDEKNKYEGAVKRITDEYKAAMTLFNSAEWEKTYEYNLKSAVGTKDQDYKNKILTKMENDLLFWQELLFPNSKKMKVYLERVQAEK